MSDYNEQIKKIALMYELVETEAQAMQAASRSLETLKDELKQEISIATQKAVSAAATVAITERLKSVNLDDLTNKLYESTTLSGKAADNAKQTALNMQKTLTSFQKSTEMSYQSLIKPFLTIFLPAITAVMFGILLSIWLLPSAADIEERKTALAQLDALGGKAKLSKCEGKLCIRVDTKKVYGEKGDYLIIK